MGKPEAENKNVEIYLRVKPSPKPSRNVSFDLVKPATGTNVPSSFSFFFLPPNGTRPSGVLLDVRRTFRGCNAKETNATSERGWLVRGV